MKKQIAACALIAASGCASGTVDGPEPTGDNGSGTTGGTSGSFGSAAPQRVGDLREVDIDLAPDLAAGESKTIEISEPGATFVKVRFASLNLDPGDQVRIADPSGDVVHRIDHSGEELWGLSAQQAPFSRGVNLSNWFQTGSVVPRVGIPATRTAPARWLKAPARLT